MDIVRNVLAGCSFALVFASGSPASAESAVELLARSIEHHDPAASWRASAHRLEIEESRPGAPSRRVEVVMDAATGLFEYRAESRGAAVAARVENDACAVEIDGSSDVSAEQVEEHGLGCERLRRLRDYYSYLWGLPMKLRDAGTILRPDVLSTSFQGRVVAELGVTYEPGVGSDAWYFYLDPGSAALVGYRFYHDESANDGEYVVLDGELAQEGLRLPRRRSWYTNAGDELLGTDTLLAISRP